MTTIITVGLGFGDEGKGATVDFLTRELNADLVVRYSGGAQAGHNVQLVDGRRHTFAQFGAGTFAGAKTWLGPRMIISPATMVPEAEHLRELGVANPFEMLSVHPDCLVSTAFHVAMNRLREVARGVSRHGSCGLGIGETRHYWLKHGPDAIVAGDLANRRLLVQKLTLLRERLLLEMQELPEVDREWAALLHKTRPAYEADVLLEASVELHVSSRLPANRTVIFEGAQGVLLDEWNGFHPHTTWSTVTPLHAWEIVEEQGLTDVTVLGITRAYSTRHGAGPFPTYCRDLTAALTDPGNPANGWQGSLRAGPLDLVLLDYAARIGQIDGLAVTCLDQLPADVDYTRAYANLDRLELPHTLREQSALTRQLELAAPVLEQGSEADLLAALEAIAPVRMTARGPSSADWQLAAGATKHSPMSAAIANSDTHG
jgi:adenylosuccinate synthase